MEHKNQDTVFLPKVKIPTNDPEENDLDEISDEKFKKNDYKYVKPTHKDPKYFQKGHK